MARFWALLRPHRAILLEALAGAALYTLLGLAMAVYVQKLVDHVLIDGNRRLLNLMSLTTLVIIAFRIFLNTMKSLFILRTGQTIDAVLIAHRLSTVVRADKIVVLAEGRVAEEGTHRELFARGGRYREMWRYQHPDLAPGPPQRRAAS